MPQPQQSTLQDRFRACLPPGEKFVCLHCIATQLRINQQTLAEAVLTPVWSHYTFANANCFQCGDHGYCAIYVGQPSSSSPPVDR